MINKLNLPQKIFNIEHLDNLKQKNIIFGKNGSGKSSITKAIKEEFSGIFDVRIFQGIDSIIKDNQTLNSIVLGVENVSLQPQIDKLTRNIMELSNELESLEENNVNSELYKVRRSMKELENKLDKFFKESARELKNSYTELTGPNYDKNAFKSQIYEAKKLQNDEEIKYRKILNEDTLAIIETSPHLDINLEELITEANKLIQFQLLETIILEFESEKHKNWVKEGLVLHENLSKCQFCQSEISKERINNLNEYFNDGVKDFENRLNQMYNQVIEKNSKLVRINLLKKSHYYYEFQQEVQELNEELIKVRDQVFEILNEIQLKLENRKNSLFNPIEKIELKSEVLLCNIDQKIEVLNSKNNEYGKKLKEKKQNAKRCLLSNQIAKLCDDFRYNQIRYEYDNERTSYNKEKNRYDKVEKILENKKLELKALQKRTKDESIAAEKINILLKKLGNKSFSLEPFLDLNQKGQYKIVGYDGELRDITTLSTGEKNIVAFLWFLFNLEDINSVEDKNQVIIFDDPMNSNDDTVQYLIITKLQELLKNLREDQQIFILTHNAHFYINLRYRWWNGKQEKKNTIHLIKTGAKTEIKYITSQSEDFDTNYKSLWDEVLFLYENDKASYMINPLRRIFETFEKFTGINLFEDNSDAQKLFNVNSHSIDDFEAELNGKNKDELIDIVKNIFKDINAEKHFEYYWNKN